MTMHASEFSGVITDGTKIHVCLKHQILARRNGKFVDRIGVKF